MPAIVIRIRQKGYIRSSGYQAVNWAVTVPVADPSGTPLLGTMPLSYAPMFVVRNTGGYDALVRVASVRDLVALPQAELRYFDIRGPGGDSVFAASGPIAGDVLTFPGTSDVLSYWLEDAAPYNTNTFVVLRRALRASGSTPQALTGNRIQLSDYTFTPSDVNRWIDLSGFTTPAYNGLTQILSYAGNTAIVSKTISTNEAGGAWQMPIVEIDSSAPGLEPRYFPTRELNLAWSLTRGAALIATAAYGGTTARWPGEPVAPLTRSVRFTALEPTNAGALALMSVVRNGVLNLQRAAAVNNTDLTPLITSTYGP